MDRFSSILRPLALLFILGIGGGCEKVEDPYQKQPGSSSTQSSAYENLSIPSDHPVTRNILIEDFTGHKCGNCPNAAVEASNLKQQYGKDRVFIAGVHCTFYANPAQQGNKYTTDFRTESGKTYKEHYSISGLPAGMINRTVWNGNRLLGVSEWSNAVSASIGDSVDVTLQMASAYDKENGNVCVDVATRFLEPIQDTLATTVYLVEDSIIDWQKNYANGGDPSYPSGDVEEYRHDHVLRAVINGTWGETVLKGSANASDEKVLSYSYSVKEGWDPAHLSVIAYVYDKDSERILQVIGQEVP